MQVCREKIKHLIILSRDVEDADKIIVDNYGFQSIGEKIAFLKGMFGVETIGHKENDEMTYYAMLDAIIFS